MNDAASRERERQRRRDLENAEAAIRNMGVEGMVDAQSLADSFGEGEAVLTAAERAATDRTWTFGHIVVDEAQELSPMQWRMLVRKNPMKSFTIVGDVAQVSAAAGTADWAEALGPIFGEAWRLEELTVNYRTPAQDHVGGRGDGRGERVPITPTRSVRDGEWPVEVIRVDGSLSEAAPGPRGSRSRRSRRSPASLRDHGAIAVIAAPATLASIEVPLAEALGHDLGRGSVGLRRPIALLTPQDAKGLEFDAVVVVEPAAIVDDGDRGAARSTSR